MTWLTWLWPAPRDCQWPSQGSIAAWQQIVIKAKQETDEEKKRLMRAEKTEHRLFAVLRTASQLWR